MIGRGHLSVWLALTLAAAAAATPSAAQRAPAGAADKVMIDETVAPENVVTRGWGHGDFGRLVFDWSGAVTYRAQIFAGQLRISFDRPLKTSLEDAQRNLSAYLTDLRIVNGRIVTAALKGHLKVRSFANDNAVVVDLVRSGEAGDDADSAQESDTWRDRMPVVPVRAGKHPGFGRVVFDWDDDVGYDIERVGDNVVVRFDRPARIDVSELAARLPGRVSEATTDLRRTDVRIALVVPGGARIRHFRDRMRVAIDVIAPDAEATADRPLPMTGDEPARKVVPSTKVADAPRNATGREEEAAGGSGDGKAGRPVSLARKRPPPAKTHQRMAENRFAGAPLVTVDATRRGSAFDVRFNWRKPVNAAVYRRGGNIWAIFDDGARFALGSLEIVGEGIVDEIVQTEAGEKSVIRFGVPEDLSATVTKTGDIWNLRLAPARMTGPVETPIQIRPVTAPGTGESVEVLAKGLKRPHRFVDPEVGDVINVYPVATPGIGNRISRVFVDFAVPASALGVAIVPHRDDLRLIRTAEGVSISRPDGMTVSRPTDVSGRKIAREVDHSLAGISSWLAGPDSDFEKNRHLMIEAVLAARGEARNVARLDLARFLLANRFAADALGVVDIVLRDDPKQAGKVDVRALQGAAHLLLGHHAKAAEAFEHQHLKDDPSVAPWRAAIAAARGDWVKAHQYMRESQGAASAMPPKLRVRFTLIGAEAALAVKDTDSAKPWIDALRTLPLNEEEALYRQYLEAHGMRLAGKPGAAINVWRTIAASGSRLLRAKAQFSLINTQLESGKIKRDEAIRQLEALGFAWRGDAFEFDVKRRLGDLYAAATDYRTSLLRLRQAASHFKEVDGAEAIAQDMRNRFRKLFLDGEADHLAPVRAIALYEEFRELTPPGTDGDEMIRKLADRLVKVDLLAEAARLLDHQVRFRLTGRERSRVGARLGFIHLLNRKPGDAVEALRLSAAADISDALARQRRLLEVRALTDMGRGDKALALLEDDVSHDAEILRLEIFWREGNWIEVARTVRRLIPQTEVDALSDSEAELVLRWAVALTLQNDIDGLLLLRDRFSDAMARSKSAEAFKVIAGVEIGEVPDFETLVKRVGDLGYIESFMAGYREKARKGEVSAIN